MGGGRLARLPPPLRFDALPFRLLMLPPDAIVARLDPTLALADIDGRSGSGAGAADGDGADAGLRGDSTSRVLVVPRRRMDFFGTTAGKEHSVNPTREPREQARASRVVHDGGKGAAYSW